MSEKRPVKATKLVVEAIKHLKAEQGFTPVEIIKYIVANHGTSEKMVKCIMTALKRGEEYGILRTERGRYALKETATLPQLLALRRKVDPEDLEEIVCKPKRRRSRRSRGKCSCGKRRRGGRSRRRSRSRRNKCRKRSSRRRIRSGKSHCSCGKRRRGGRRRSRRGGRKRRGGRRRRGGKKCGGRRGRRSRRSRRRSRRSRRRRSKCRC